MHDSRGLHYLDPAPDISKETGNESRLQALNDFFSGITTSFLNFSEAGNFSLPLLSALPPPMNIIIVPDSHARIVGCIYVEPSQLAEQMSEGIIPPRVHFPCLDCHHLNIAKPFNPDHPTYRLTKTYVANWVQRRATVVNNT
ncbi:unnamed protein product, partial [Rotaria magnacalcarata]